MLRKSTSTTKKIRFLCLRMEGEFYKNAFLILAIILVNVFASKKGRSEFPTFAPKGQSGMRWKWRWSTLLSAGHQILLSFMYNTTSSCFVWRRFAHFLAIAKSSSCSFLESSWRRYTCLWGTMRIWWAWYGARAGVTIIHFFFSRIWYAGISQKGQIWCSSSYSSARRYFMRE